MGFRQQIADAERLNGSLLCVGLDPEPDRFPGAWRGDAARIFDFCSAIVDATRDLVIAFKPQIAHFAAHRAEAQLERLIAYIHAVAPAVPVILDAKRGDVGSTAEHYAVEAFERYRADAVTLSPFMGFDSIAPYLKYRGKGVILLCRTSNAGGADLQAQTLVGSDGQAPGDKVFERIARLAAGPWARMARSGNGPSGGHRGDPPGGQSGGPPGEQNAGPRGDPPGDQSAGPRGDPPADPGDQGADPSGGELALVVGATYPAEVRRVRELAPELPLLIPGIGAQGGDAAATVQAGWRGDASGRTTAPIIVSSSRAILYAGSGGDGDTGDFAAAARAVAVATRRQLNDARGGN